MPLPSQVACDTKTSLVNVQQSGSKPSTQSVGIRTQVPCLRGTSPGAHCHWLAPRQPGIEWKISSLQVQHSGPDSSAQYGASTRRSGTTGPSDVADASFWSTSRPASSFTAEHPICPADRSIIARNPDGLRLRIRWVEQKSCLCSYVTRVPLRLEHDTEKPAGAPLRQRLPKHLTGEEPFDRAVVAGHVVRTADSCPRQKVTEPTAATSQ